MVPSLRKNPADLEQLRRSSIRLRTILIRPVRESGYRGVIREVRYGGVRQLLRAFSWDGAGGRVGGGGGSGIENGRLHKDGRMCDARNCVHPV